jgi:hypothetical protein
MNFVVVFKGIRYYCGKLAGAYRYVEERWGTCDAAWAIGVKLQPAMDVRIGR